MGVVRRLLVVVLVVWVVVVLVVVVRVVFVVQFFVVQFLFVFERIELWRLTPVNTATRTRGSSVVPAILRIETDEEVPDARYRCPW